MKLVVIIVVVVVLLGGGAGAAYFFRDAIFGEESADVAAKAPIEEVPDALFVDLETLNIAVINNRRIDKHVVLQVALEVVDDEARVRVAKSLPRIKDAFIQDMYEFYAYQQPGQKGVNVEVIKRRLKHTVDNVMKDGSVKNVLIQGAIERQTKPK